MLRTFAISAVGVAVVATPIASFAAEMSYVLRARVPVHCQVVQRAPGDAVATGAAVSLGQFREYCNAPGGYELIVRYAPGTLEGAILTAGEDRAVLDGSGQAVLSRAAGPRFRERAILATPGEQGFDTDRIEFQLIPA